MPAAVLWTGGKDSSLALQESKEAGIDVRLLVTFAPENPDFHAHPLWLIQEQAASLDIPHHICSLLSSSVESYKRSLQDLQNKGIDTIITGDIDEVNGYPNWMEMCCKPLGIRVIKPLWQRERAELCESIFLSNFDVVISCVNTRMLSHSFLGQRFNRSCIDNLRNVSVDLCGENGEFHTMTLNMPLFNQALKERESIIKIDGDFAYLDWCQSQKG